MTFFRLSNKDENRGFTLIEILVVIGIIAILAAIVLIAINPARQFAQANNSQRESNVNAILNAVGQYMADNQGDISALGITQGDATDPGDYGDISDSDVDLCSVLIPAYMAALPVDPNNGEPVEESDCGSTYDTGYDIIQDSNTNRITVLAPQTEPPATEDVSVTR